MIQFEKVLQSTVNQNIVQNKRKKIEKDVEKRMQKIL